MAACSPKRHAPWRWLMVAVLFGLAAGRLSTAAAPASAETIPAEHVAAAQQAKVIPADGAESDNFGCSVAVSGDTMVVGALRDDDDGLSSGSAYIFVRSGGVWMQQAKLTATDAAAGDLFGSSVAIEGDTVVVGADSDDDGGLGSGSAYVFVQAGGVWAQQAKLTADDAATGDRFGGSVTISGNTVVMGARGDSSFAGSAYVFVRTGTTWAQQDKLTATDLIANDMFGSSVAISGETIVVGTPHDNAPLVDSGSAYVFVRTGSSWAQQTKLTVLDAVIGDNFGNSVAISGDTVVVGASSAKDLGVNSGCSYVFVRTGTDWIQQTKLLANDGAENDHFGSSVALSGNTAIIGAYGYNHPGGGSAYVFTWSGGAWTQQARHSAGDGAVGDQLGYSAALSGSTAAVGAWQANSRGTDSGAAYAFLMNEPPLAEAGPNQEVQPGAKVILNAANSRDRDGSIRSYQWKQVNGRRVTLSKANSKQASFKAPPADRSGVTLGFQVKVKDSGGLSAIDRCLVTVTASHRAPIAKAGPPQKVTGGTVVLLNGGSSRDSDGGALKYSWKQICGPPVHLSVPSPGIAAFAAPAAGWCGASLGFRLTVTDADGLKSEDTTLVNVCAGNQPPKSRAGKKQTVAGGAKVRLDGSTSTDPDDGIASYRWEQLSGPPVKLSNPLAMKLIFKSPRAGQGGTTLLFQLSVTDQGGLQSQSRCQVRVKASP